MGSPDNLDADARYQLGVISGKLDLILVQNADFARQTESRFVKIEGDVAEQSERLGVIERNKSWALGVAAAVSAAISAIGFVIGLK
ncbi:hypothetical protein JDBV08_00480 [Mycobacterium phage jiawei]|uniref:hypothetical protein n=1 Tax=Brevundimonas diminuta TaxID=293 RepID=UPI0019087E65|nr:hypothetical protein [Brevundimonas diminuta]MBK1968424.1 hypothetical protein [Brevundimonas diminuta]WRQ08263.1 hypothetical protein JDBV08_00480 [Mycobacterium phage jiawei]